MPYKLGNAQKVTNYWTFIQIFDMTHLLEEFNTLNNKYSIFRNNINNYTDYKIEFYNSFIIIDNLKTKIETQIDQIIPNETRKKRALINALGNIIKTITGNLDEDDAEYFDQNINSLKQNQNNLKLALDKQMSLLNKSMDVFQESIKNISHNQIILESRILQITNVIKEIRLNQIEYLQISRIHMVLSQITNFYQNIYDILERIEVAITFAKLNIFHNAIANIKEFFGDLQRINNYLKFEKLPFEPHPDNVLKLLSTLELKSYIKNKELIFIIEIPLVEKENYNLFQLFPLPTKNKDHFKIIIPNFDYLIINNNNFGYSNQPCKQIIQNEYLCSHIHSENFYKDTPCEVQLLQYKHNISNCNPIYVKLDNIQLQNIDKNKWILITNKDTVGIETCNRIENKIVLDGTYLIELSFPCNLNINDIYIRTHRNIIKNAFMNIPLPNVNLSYSQSILYEKVKLLNLKNINFNKFDELLKDINSQKSENAKILNNPIYYNKTSFWTVLLYIIILIIFIILLYKYLWPIYFNQLKIKNHEKSSNEIII